MMRRLSDIYEVHLTIDVPDDEDFSDDIRECIIPPPDTEWTPSSDEQEDLEIQKEDDKVIIFTFSTQDIFRSYYRQRKFCGRKRKYNDAITPLDDYACQESDDFLFSSAFESIPYHV